MAIRIIVTPLCVKVPDTAFFAATKQVTCSLAVYEGVRA